MIRTSTVVYLVLLLVLVGAYFYLKNRGEQSTDIELTAEPTEEISYLFSAEEGTPSAIRIESGAGDTIEIERDTESAWALIEPFEAAANQGAAEAAATQILTMRILDTVPDVEPGIVGLENPEFVLTVEFAPGVTQTVAIGMLTPTHSGYYVRDPGGQVIIVSRNAIDALLGLLDNPPYLETPTPSPTSATPEIGVSATATP